MIVNGSGQQVAGFGLPAGPYQVVSEQVGVVQSRIRFEEPAQLCEARLPDDELMSYIYYNVHNEYNDSKH